MALTQVQGEMVAGGTGALTVPAGTTAQRPSNPFTGMVRYNTTLGYMEYYNGSVWGSVGYSGIVATGGTLTTYTSGSVTYNVHTFNSSGTFTVLNGGTATYLIVAGGGGGGGSYGGGGGAGGLLSGTASVTKHLRC